MTRRNGCALVLVATLASPEAAHGQEKPPPVFGATVTVVTLPVFVTDKDGRPVPGLTPADFEVQDEGKPVKIVGLQEIDAGAPLPPMSWRTAAAARRQFLLLFDLSFSSVSGLVRSREAASEFVRSGLGPNDLAGVATFSLRGGMKLLVGFTSDHTQLLGAIDRLGVLDLDRKADPLGLVYDFDLMRPQSAAAPGNAREDRLNDELRVLQVLYRKAEAADYSRKVSGLVGSMGQLARTLDSLQGRKQVIYLSAGFEESTLVGAQGDQARKDSEAVVEGRLWEVQSDSRFGDSGIRQQLERMMRAFSSADVVVHTVDVTGLAARSDAALEGDQAVPLGAGRESLSQIASGTGGRFIRNTNNLGAALGEILEATRRYYVLAYEVESRKGPGKFHKLKVRVRAKDREVSHRSGYVEGPAEPVNNPLARRFEAAEAIAKGVAGGEIVLHAVAVPYRTAQGKITLPVVLEIDGASLLARGPGDSLPLEIYGYVLDEKGAVEDVVALAPTLSLPKVGPKLQQRGIQLHSAFTVPAGRHSLRFLVRDGEKGRRGLYALDVTVPSFEDRALLLSPPLFMGDPGEWLVLQGPSRYTPVPEMPFRVASDLFTPKGRPRLVSGEAQSICILAFTAGAAYDPGAQFEIKAQLLDGDGTAVRMGRLQLGKAVAEPDGFRRFVLTLTPGDVAPGEYSFRVRVKDPATGVESEATQPVSVE